jgi:hypothetical protein
MAYRRARYGLMPIDPEDLKDQVNPGAVARMEPADPRRNELRDVKRGAERGWRVSEAVKDKALEVVVEVLDDWSATNRDRLSAVGAVTAMVGQDIRIDQTQAENADINVLDAIRAGVEKMKAMRGGRLDRYLVTPLGTPVPSPVTPAPIDQGGCTLPGTPPRVDAPSYDHLSPGVALFLEKHGRLPEGTCASMGIYPPDEAAPPAPTWEDRFDAAPDHAAKMDVVAALRRAAADGDDEVRQQAQFYLKHGGNTKVGGLRHFLETMNGGC